MNTLESILLIITAVCISLFFVIGTLVTIYLWIIIRRMIKKAEFAIYSVETASNIIKEVRNKKRALSVFSVLKYMFKHNRKA